MFDFLFDDFNKFETRGKDVKILMVKIVLLIMVANSREFNSCSKLNAFMKV